MYQVDIADEQRTLPVDRELLVQAIETILQGEGIATAQISIALVDDAAMQRLHAQYLDIDEPTDVLSFVLESSPQGLEGEVIVSTDTAQRASQQYGWPAEDEALLYVIHGTLHLVGYDDLEDETRQVMRAKERHYLGLLGKTPPDASGQPASSSRGQA